MPQSSTTSTTCSPNATPAPLAPERDPHSCRSGSVGSDLNPADCVIWVRAADKESSYMFLTHADLKLVRALYLRNNAFPEVLDAPSAQIQAIYKDALVALGKDVDKVH